MNTPKKFWIKERNNPQVGTYYVREGQLSKRAAAKIVSGTLYGSNRMIPFDTKDQMDAAYERLALEGNRCS